MESAARRPGPVECVVASIAALVGVLEVAISSPAWRGADAWSCLAVLVVAGSLLWVRADPVVPALTLVSVWALVALVASTQALFYGQLLVLEVVLFALVRYGRGRLRWIGVGLLAGALVLTSVGQNELRPGTELLLHGGVTVLVALGALGLRRHVHGVEESTRRAVDAEVAAAELTLQAVMAERARIAREMHDVVAHSVTSMVVQAGAAEQALDEPEFVAGALRAIRATGNDALGEMRLFVTMLREDGSAPLAPQPGLARLPDLVELTTAHGTRTRLEVTGGHRDLPIGADLALYRIVQEALTNVRRHAHASECVVRIDYRAQEVRIDVLDDGHGCTDVEPDVGGQGLVGMRERVAMYGGRLDAGPRPDGGFAVRVNLPVAS